MPDTATKKSETKPEKEGDGYTRSSFAVRNELFVRMKPLLLDLGVRSPSELLSIILENPAKFSHYVRPYVDEIQNQEAHRKSARVRQKEERADLLKKMREMPLEDLRQLQTRAQAHAKVVS